MSGDEDACRVETVDGEPIRVLGSGEWDDADRTAFAEIVRAAKRRHAAEHPTTCRQCGRGLPPEQDAAVDVFCSPSCFARWSALVHPETDPDG